MYIEEMPVTTGLEKKTYSFDEAVAASKEYFGGDELAATVWVNKYALKDSDGNIYEHTPTDMHRRLAKEISRVEKRYPNPLSEDEIFEVLDHFRYIIPQGGPMAGIGNPYQVASLSNCFVIGHEGPSDSYGGIMKIDQEQVQLMKRRGGVGHDLSHIRPTSSPVLNSALTSTGVVPFMERYSNSTREVAQDGRRGALMLSISVKHPDAEYFVDAKTTKGKVTGANVSVKLTDEFMHAVINKKPFVQQFPIEADNPVVKREIDANLLWDKIIHNAWKSAEPGVLFWDTVIKESVPDCYDDLGYKTVSTNPCGEIPLCPYDSCRLLALNLYSYLDNPFTKEAKFNFEKFQKHIHLAQRIMDDIIDLELEKIDAIHSKIAADPEDYDVKRVELKLWENIRQKANEGRRTGIGITAEGDMLAGLGLQYGSDNGVDFSTEVHKTMAVEAYRSSVNLAKERGAFLMYDAQREKDNPFIQRLAEADPELYKEMTKWGRRNLALLTIAPTGTTSLMTQTTSGIEPVFMPVYRRRRKVNPNDSKANVTFVDDVGDSWEEYNVFHHKFMDWLTISGYDPELLKSKNEKEIQELVDKSPYYKSTSTDVDWIAKVNMQGQVQKWVDHSISVTVNLPKNISEKKVAEVYKAAWESGCKGVTVYREGSREGVLLTGKAKEKGTVHSEAQKRPKVLEAELLRFKNDNEDWIAFVGVMNGLPYEIFTGKVEEDVLLVPKNIRGGKILKVKNPEGNSRYDFQYTDKYGNPCTVGGLSFMFDKEFWNYAKLISGVLRHGMPIPYVVNLVSSLSLDSEHINSWKAGVARTLKKYIKDGTKAVQGESCEECGETQLVYQEGCLICTRCGHSKCG
ncbi:MAG: adenosylcobalamin-dependent ribonucleoside-diphosphate reductase [Bacteroidetes bacterium]|jgi:ribonucleoside-diphosphate reductase alpha chain|nr:adenosylcobalamin-dependent ribonucleoside-diphosphate reductase [Bacteroidota bacterium]MBT3748127.1 adenosylcobalamin-dependent ribonucleoside-diphosphate reductase [Bacteroidota bacterium]MBT4410587.1 adenosylcobalamin-dependent ribonucleoside-diphosphate reductase [Bacteroidota bacterium]MBT5427866.1 adenosylcobalamin-dependent ribonucleoside-diphosphate reductase [Bacteroidota bacterium]MBT7095665.1 adenosylcobalamin-dependent ribonucleoside-diphosphate reductase [Bacteroidota bacterium